MGYFIVVIAQTIVLPLVSGTWELFAVGGDPVLVYGKWWVFWGVGTRLLLAGIVQVSGGGPTAEILGSATASTARLIAASSATADAPSAVDDAVLVTEATRRTVADPPAAAGVVVVRG